LKRQKTLVMLFNDDCLGTQEGFIND